MFGILFGGLLVGVIVYNKIAGFTSNSFKRTDAIGNNQLTYIDRNNKTRLCSNNRIVMYGWKNGRHVIMDPASGYVYHDLDLNKEKEAVRKAKRDGETVISFFSKEKQCYKYGKGVGTPDVTCRDIETGAYLRIIMVNSRCFYLDTMENKILRITDKQKRIDNGLEKGISSWSKIVDDAGEISDNEIINSFNKFMDKLDLKMKNGPEREKGRLEYMVTKKEFYCDRKGNVTYPANDHFMSKVYCLKVLHLQEITHFDLGGENNEG